MFLKSFVKGVLFSNGRHTKGVSFLRKMVYKRVRVGFRGGASPYKNIFSTLPSPLGLRLIILISFFSTFNWTVPFCSYLMCVIFTLGTVVLYLVPLKFLLLAWGKDADISVGIYISTSCHFLE